MYKLNDSVVLVTGGGGFIGSHLVDRLLKEDVREVRIIDNFSTSSMENLSDAIKNSKVKICENSDIRDFESIKPHFKDVDYVFHLAAIKQVYASDNPDLIINTNIIGTYNVLKACVEFKCKKIIFASSVSSYGLDEKSSIKEDTVFKAREFYGASKVAGEQLCRVFFYNDWLDYVALRYFFVYGPRLHIKNSKKGFVINKVFDRIEKGIPPEIYGDGLQKFDYIYIDDAIEATILALKSNITNEVFNIGTGVQTTIKQLIELILKATGSNLNIIYTSKDETSGTSRIADTTKAQKELGFKYKVDLEEGIKKVIEWRKQEKAKDIN